MKNYSENELTPKKCESTNNRFWDIKDLSKYLNIKVKTIYSMVPDIPHYRIGKLIRFKEAEIEDWLESKRENIHDKLQFGRPRVATSNINLLIRKTIDQSRQKDYNSDHGKSDRIKTHNKEIYDGSI